MTIAGRPAARRTAGLAFVIAIAACLPAAAASITVKNCTGSTQRVELRPGTGTQDEGTAMWVVDIYHTRTWTGACGTSLNCWVKVRPGEGNEANVQSTGEVCLLIPASSRPVTLLLSDCGCS